MGDDRDQEAIREYSASLTPEERADFARALLESTPRRPSGEVGSPVPQAVVWASRVACIGITAYYWSLRGFASNEILRLMLSLFFPIIVVTFPNQLSGATGHLLISPRISRASPPRAVLVLGWLILLLPILLSLVCQARA
jgi:hypothetical protein